jgi:hypothetical protein
MKDKNYKNQHLKVFTSLKIENIILEIPSLIYNHIILFLKDFIFY